MNDYVVESSSASIKSTDDSTISPPNSCLSFHWSGSYEPEVDNLFLRQLIRLLTKPNRICEDCLILIHFNTVQYIQCVDLDKV